MSALMTYFPKRGGDIRTKNCHVMEKQEFIVESTPRKTIRWNCHE